MVITSEWRRNRFLKDDYLRDVEEIIYLVILNDHPSESVIVIPKYVPKQGGKWRGAYRRLFRNYTSTELHMAANEDLISKYEFYSNHFGTNLLSIPHDLITEHYVPENKLKELLSSPRKDLSSLALIAVDLARIFLEMGIEESYMGITGSLLYNLHMPFSNLSVVLYGLNSASIYLERIDEVVAENRCLRFKSEFLDLKGKQVDFASRIRSFLWMNDISTAIHVNEFPDFQFAYGSEQAHSIGNCEITATISKVREGFVRKKYLLHPLEVISWPEKGSLPDTLWLKIFSGRSEDIVFIEGEIVRVKGVLQWILPVMQQQKKAFFQISVGLEELPGYAYPFSLLTDER